MNSFDPENNKVIGGNYALMDQQLALKFIYDNSIAIGGNGDRLAINGGSAGANSCSFQLIHPESGLKLKIFYHLFVFFPFKKTQFSSA